MAESDFVLRVLTVLAFENCGDLFWRVDGEYAPITLFINCNDVFAWACSDCEKVTPENVAELERAYSDAKAADPDLGMVYASMLFCARVRGMRPQGAAYPKRVPAIWSLFDACGPERPIDYGNPCAPGAYPMTTRGAAEPKT